MHDTLNYIAKDPIHRQYHHHDMTFGLLYAFTENFILPLSHDEVVHGKGSLIGKMPGDRWQRFANLRAYFGFMWGHPGKKLLFMGGEFAQEREWNHDRELDWPSLEDPVHAGVQRLVRDLNALYASEPALHQRDCEPNGFQWTVGDDRANSVFSFLRYAARQPSDPCGLQHDAGAAVRLPHRRAARTVAGAKFSTAIPSYYGGSNVGNDGRCWRNEHCCCMASHHSVELTLPPLATIYLRHALIFDGIKLCPSSERGLALSAWRHLGWFRNKFRGFLGSCRTH